MLIVNRPYVQFRAVCSSWRIVSLPKPCHLPPQLPWLMILHEPNERDDGMRLFYDLWESKMRKIHLQEAIGMACLASCNGWLLLTKVGGKEVVLLNPLTRARIWLPPFSFPFKPLRRGYDKLPYKALYLFHPYMHDHAVSKMNFSANPTDPNCLMTVFHQGIGTLFCCQVGEPCWTFVTSGPSLAGFDPLLDATYCNGQFYLLDHHGRLKIIESNGDSDSIIYYIDTESQAVSTHRCFLTGKSGIYVCEVCEVQSIVEDDKDDSAAHGTKEITAKTHKKKIELYQLQEQSMKHKQITDTNSITIFSGCGDFCLAVCSVDWHLMDHVGGNYMYVVSSEGDLIICSTKIDNV